MGVIFGPPYTGPVDYDETYENLTEDVPKAIEDGLDYVGDAVAEAAGDALAWILPWALAAGLVWLAYHKATAPGPTIIQVKGGA